RGVTLDQNCTNRNVTIAIAASAVHPPAQRKPYQEIPGPNGRSCYHRCQRSAQICRDTWPAIANVQWTDAFAANVVSSTGSAGQTDTSLHGARNCRSLGSLR